MAALACAASAAAEVEFARDVRPLLEARCVECHGALELNGGLRLDRRAYAFMGGDSGVSALEPDLASNPLWARVTSPDPAARMPFEQEPLAPEELALLRAWIEAGAPWPSELEGEAVLPDAPQVGRDGAGSPRLRAPGSWFVATYLHPLAPWALLGALALLACARLARAHAAGRPWAQGRLGALAARAGGSGLLALGLSLGWAMTAAVLLQVARDRDAEWRGSHAASAVYGDPPEPQRPSHGRRLAGTYWRGNCERHPELYNGGYYATAILRLDVCDEAGESLGYGDLVPGRVYARLVIERAPNANPGLFSDVLMEKVVLTRVAAARAPTPLPADAVHLTIQRPRNRFEARVPLDAPGPGIHHTRVYLYSGVVHYAIDATLVVDEAGSLAPASDVWLGSLYWNPRLARPEPGKVPLEQWFDHRAMPLIDREHTEDPTLLGTDQYLDGDKK
ncbi:MAG: c-type cytochrome domain-containing protein [Planctomycetota bacterium]